MADVFDMAATLKARLVTLDDLKDRVEETADLAELIRRKLVPNRPVTAWIVPAGLRPRGEGEAGAGAFTQLVDEHFAVVLALRSSGDATGARALPRLNVLVWQIIEAVCGSDDEDAVGVFRLAGGRIVGLNAGLVTYQLEFAIQLQLRTI